MAEPQREHALKVHHLRPAPGSHRPKTRVGRGEGGKGKTAGRGTKGTKARYQVLGRLRGRPDAAAHAPAEAARLHQPVPGHLPGGQPGPARRPVPRGRPVTVADLVARGAVRDGYPVKVLGSGEVGVALQVSVHAFSGSAREKITAAGGTVTTL